jgi:hypothetical protein
MSKFTEWFSQKLTVGRYPMPGEIREMPEGSYIINVSDEWIPGCYATALRCGIFYHWLPMNECTGEMGINSLFGALQLLHYAEEQNLPVLLHCHAGANRSPTVAHAYYFMRTGQHWQDQEPLSLNAQQINIWLGVAANTKRTNMLLLNVEEGLLPELGKLEKFLKQLGLLLNQREFTYRGGLLTQLKIDTGIS